MAPSRRRHGRVEQRLLSQVERQGEQGGRGISRHGAARHTGCEHPRSAHGLDGRRGGDRDGLAVRLHRDEPLGVRPGRNACVQNGTGLLDETGGRLGAVRVRPGRFPRRPGTALHGVDARRNRREPARQRNHLCGVPRAGVRVGRLGVPRRRTVRLRRVLGREPGFAATRGQLALATQTSTLDDRRHVPPVAAPARHGGGSQ